MIRIMKQHLLEALKGLSKVVCTKTSLPILSCVRIKADKELVSVSGTDLDQWLECRIPAEVAEPLDCIVSLDKLKEFLGGGDGRIMICIAAAGKNVTLSMDVAGQQMERILDAMPLEDWPQFKLEPKRMEAISKEVFSTMKLAYPSASKDDSRRAITGICLDKDGVAATDGSQLVKLNCTLPLKEQVILPNTKILASGFFKDDGLLGVIMDKKEITHVRFQSGILQYTARCIVGNYPNFNQVIPGDEALQNRIVFSAEDAAMLAKSIPKLEGYRDDQQGIVLYAGSRGVKFMSRSPASPVMLETKAEYRGRHAEFMAALQRKFILRALEIGCTELRFSDGNSPFVASGGAGIHVFMPMRNVLEAVECWKKIGIKPKEDEMKKSKLEGGTEVQVPVQNVNPAQPAQAAAMVPAPEPAKEQKQGLTMVGAETDPFEELIRTSEETKLKIRDAFEAIAGFQRKIRDAQKAVKAREKSYRNTRELVEKFRTAANF